MFHINEIKIYKILYNHVKIVSCCFGLLTVHSTKKNNQEVQQLGKKMRTISQQTWSLNINKQKNGLTYHEILYQTCKNDFLIKTMIEIFPHLKINDITRYDLS